MRPSLRRNRNERIKRLHPRPAVILLTLLISAASALNAGFARADSAAEINVGLPNLERSDSVSVLASGDIERAHTGSSDDVLRTIPGVAVVRSGGPGQPSFIYIRGADSAGTMVLLDGLPLNDPSLNNKAFDFSLMSLDAVERVEVWKGPQSVRFGSGATGGVINIVSKKGQGPFKLNLGAEGGSYDTYKGWALARGSDGPYSYSFSANRLQSAGISAADGFSEPDASWNNTFSTRLGFSSSAANEVELSVRYSEKYADLDYAPMATAPYVYADATKYRSKGNSLALGLNGHHRWTSAWESQVHAMRFAQTRHYTSDPEPANPSSLAGRYDGEFYRVENINSWKPGGGLELSFGPTVDFETASSEYHSTSFNSDFPKQSTSLYGAMARAQLDRRYFFANAGTRYDRHSRFGGQSAFEVSPGVHIAADLDLMARFATAYKAPTLFELYDPQSGLATLQPEDVQGYEISLTRFFEARRSRLQLSLFKNEFRNLIQFSSLNKYANVGSALTEGIELEGRRNFGWFEFQFGYTYLESRDNLTGESLFRRPRNSLTARVDVHPSDSTSASLDFVSADHREDLNPISAKRTLVSSYQVLNGTLEWQTMPSLKVYARILNLLDAKYEESAGYGTYRRSVFIGAIYGL